MSEPGEPPACPLEGSAEALCLYRIWRPHEVDIIASVEIAG